jgi:hypothetical protein
MATKRPMRFTERPRNVPILQSRGPRDSLLSKGWTARGAIQSVGATIVAVGFLLGSVALFIGSIVVRAQTAEMIGGILGQIFGIMLAMLAFSLACALMFLAARFLQGVARSFYK